MEGTDLDLGEDDYESSASWETINDPMCPNGEPCICIDIDGSCDDGDDDWGCINNGEEEYFCSNDGKDYAEFMGGLLCAETPENACPTRASIPAPPPSVGWPFLFVCSDRCCLVVSQFV